MPDFVKANVTTDPVTIVNNAYTAMTAAYPGWTAREGYLEVILLNILAQVAADNATVASVMTAAAFRAMGTKLFGVTYNAAALATATTTWTLADTVGHTIPAGTYVTITGLGFQVQADVVVAPGSATATVTLVATDTGTAYNGLSNTPVLVNQIDWVTSIAIVGVTAGGADAEDDAAYQNRLASALQLQAPRPVTADNFSAMSLLVPSATLPVNTIGRATTIDGFHPTATTTFTATTTNTSANLTLASSTTGLGAGTGVSGTGIPANTTILSISGATVTMDKAATASAAGVTITATGTYGNARTVTTFVTDTVGAAVSSGNMTTLAAWLAAFREANFLNFVVAPTFNTVYITGQVHVLPGYTSATVITNVQAALTSYLSPQLWGSPSPSVAGSSKWLNGVQGFNVLRYNKLLNVIESVSGVDYVPPGSAGLAVGFAPSPSGTADLIMSGAAPLPAAGPTLTITAV